MNLKPTLIIKHMNSAVVVNIASRENTLACSGKKESIERAVSCALKQYSDIHNIDKILVSKDFTRRLATKKIPLDILYVKIMPEGDSWQKSEADFSDKGDVSSNISSLDLIYDQEGRYVNMDEIEEYIKNNEPKYIALNYVHTTKSKNIEYKIYNFLESAYPNILILPSRNLFDRNFIARGNTQLLNLLLLPTIEAYLASLKRVLREVGIDAPIYFLRTNMGLVGEDTILTQGVNTLDCEDYLYIKDMINLSRKNDILVGDCDSGSLYYVKKNMSNVMLTTLELANSKVLGFKIEKHCLVGLDSAKSLQQYLDKKIPYRGPIPFYVMGCLPFRQTELFKYPIYSISLDDVAGGCTINKEKYKISAETVIGEQDNVHSGRDELEQQLIKAAKKDRVQAVKEDCSYKLEPIKYLRNKAYMLKVSMEVGL